MRSALKVLKGEQFASALVLWQKQHGRQHLPWQHTGDAYKVWLSEVMLQQTQVATVLAYYAKFLQAYPTVADLAVAPEQDVMQLWAGLGYYTRARNLHACAKQVVARFGGKFPRVVVELESLPGIGQSTAGAIASLAYGVPAPILDGNVKRVFCRYYGIEGYAEQAPIKKKLWAIAADNVPVAEPGVYNQALMDLGATCCLPRNPVCSACPLMGSCEALRKGMVGQLPTPKPKKPRPELHFISLIVQDEHGRVLLELQTGKGVWQSLWTPPCVACSAQPDTAELFSLVDQWIERYGLANSDVGAKQALCGQMETLHGQPWLVHELTHRKMHFKVLVLTLPGVRGGFYMVDEKPVPKIVHKLMVQVAQLLQSTQGAVAKQNALDF
ncbi:A/G-specific adenine glycosylase [Limnobacter sp.]|uniref:A/G-specific adenine glycosylase n=1 Tax=Limnobacter sp. TaxID=2003368 RepID=UPI002FE31FAB